MQRLTPLEVLALRTKELDVAQQRYEEAYEHAVKSEVSKQSIGMVLGCSGTAVTKYAKRHGWIT